MEKTLSVKIVKRVEIEIHMVLMCALNLKFEVHTILSGLANICQKLCLFIGLM